MHDVNFLVPSSGVMARLRTSPDICHLRLIVGSCISYSLVMRLASIHPLHMDVEGMNDILYVSGRVRNCSFKLRPAGGLGV
jgi:hypothetical protein